LVISIVFYISSCFLFFSSSVSSSTYTCSTCLYGYFAILSIVAYLYAIAFCALTSLSTLYLSSSSLLTLFSSSSLFLLSSSSI
jgi:hypothetical protein